MILAELRPLRLPKILANPSSQLVSQWDQPTRTTATTVHPSTPAIHPSGDGVNAKMPTLVMVLVLVWNITHTHNTHTKHFQATKGKKPEHQRDYKNNYFQIFFRENPIVSRTSNVQNASQTRVLDSALSNTNTVPNNHLLLHYMVYTNTYTYFYLSIYNRH